MTTRTRVAGIAIVVGLAALLAGCRSDTVWSPNSQSLALDPKGLLFTFDLATRKFQQRTKGPALALNPTWSPDGKRITYYQVGMKGQDIATLDLMAFDPATASWTWLGWKRCCKTARSASCPSPI